MEHHSDLRAGPPRMGLHMEPQEGKMEITAKGVTYFSDKWCLGSRAHTRRCHHRQGSTKPHFYSSRAGSSWGPSVPQRTHCHSGYLKQRPGARPSERQCGRAPGGPRPEAWTKITVSELSYPRQRWAGVILLPRQIIVMPTGDTRFLLIFLAKNRCKRFLSLIFLRSTQIPVLNVYIFISYSLWLCENELLEQNMEVNFVFLMILIMFWLLKAMILIFSYFTFHKLFYPQW